MTVEEATANFPKKTGIARYGEPNEVAELMAFFVSPGACWMTGSTVRMDGGEVKSVWREHLLLRRAATPRNDRNGRELEAAGRKRTSRSSSKPSDSRQSAAVSRMHSNLGCRSNISLTSVTVSTISRHNHPFVSCNGHYRTEDYCA